MITLKRDYHAINGTISDAKLMRNRETKELEFRPLFARSFYESLYWESESDMILSLNAQYNRKHFIYEGNVLYVDGAICSQYFATIDGD